MQRRLHLKREMSFSRTMVSPRNRQRHRHWRDSHHRRWLSKRRGWYQRREEEKPPTPEPPKPPPRPPVVVPTQFTAALSPTPSLITSPISSHSAMNALPRGTKRKRSMVSEIDPSLL